MTSNSYSTPHGAPVALAVFDAERKLTYFAGLIDAIEDPDRKTKVLDEFGAELLNAKEQRDCAAAFSRYCENQEKFANDEIARLKKRRDRIVQIRMEFERYLITLIAGFAEPDSRGVKRLDGNISSLRIQRNPDSVIVNDFSAVPLRLKDLVVTLPAYVWEALLERVGLDERTVFEELLTRVEVKPDKLAIGSELRNGDIVPGAALQAGAFRLVVS